MELKYQYQSTVPGLDAFWPEYRRCNTTSIVFSVVNVAHVQHDNWRKEILQSFIDLAEDFNRLNDN